jgi:hypothetical protein
VSRSWQSLEAIPSQAAVAAEWNRWLGRDADLFRSAFLRRNGREARSYPCPRDCGCAHQVVKHGDGAIVAVCQCDTNRCDDIPLQPADIAVYELNRQKLGRALAAALDATARETDLGIPGTVQVAVYGDDAVPVILAFANDREAFLRCVTGLVARLRDCFILLAPTDSMLDGNSQEALKNAGAVFLPIEKAFTFTPQGKLHPVKPSAQLLAALQTGDREPLPEDTARAAYAMVQKLDTEKALKPPTLLKVFHLYCVQGMSSDKIAKDCKCSKGTVINRMRDLREALKMNLDDLRAYATTFEDIERDIANTPGRYVHRKAMIYDDAGLGEE